MKSEIKKMAFTSDNGGELIIEMDEDRKVGCLYLTDEMPFTFPAQLMPEVIRFFQSLETLI